MSDFWNSLTQNSNLNRPTVMDEYLSQGQKKANAEVYYHTDKGRQERALKLPVHSGTRVAFVASLDSMMGSKNPPGDGHTGTVIMVRTASYGDVTSVNDYVFVKWDRGDMQQVDRHYLTRASNNIKMASNYLKVAFGEVDFTSFLKLAEDSDDLVHKATQDLWSCQQGDNGEVIISRLFDETGKPLKV